MHKIIVFNFSLFIAIICFGSCSVHTFQMTLDKSAEDRGVTVEQTNDEGYVITGYTTPTETRGHDVLILKTDQKGDTLWSKIIGGGAQDNGWAIRQVDGGGFVMVGYTRSFGNGGMDIYLAKFDYKGNVLWEKTYGGKDDDYGWDIRETLDGGFIIAAQTILEGTANIDAYLIKTDKEGNVEWANNYGGDKIDRIFSVRQTQDGGYVATGITYSFGAGDRDAYLIKADGEGNQKWFKTFGGSGYDVGHCVTVVNDGGILVAGYGDSFTENGNRDGYFFKTDQYGELQWHKTWGGRDNERIMKAEQTKDNGFISIGFTQISHSGRKDWDLYLTKMDVSGNVIWMKNYGSRNKDEYGYTVSETNDGGFILTGHSVDHISGRQDLLLIKTDKNGRVKN